MKKTRNILIVIVLLLGLVACRDKPTVKVSVAPGRPSESTFAFTRVSASLLNRKPMNDMDKPGVLMLINQGDQVIPIQESDNWTQVQHVVTGTLGWLHKSFVQVEARSKWWSGDTDRARSFAETIYKDKNFVLNNWPVAHITIEERWNKAVVSVFEDRDFPKNQAVECAEFVLMNLKERFSGWRDRQVFISGTANNEPYNLVMTDDKKPLFL